MPRLPLLALPIVFLIAACEPIDTSALREIETTVAAARTTAESVNSRTAEVQRAIDDPVAALRAATLGATFTRTATAEANIFVLTDLQTGCQWFATYGPDGAASSMAPRTESGGAGTRQRCIAVPGVTSPGDRAAENG